MHGSTVHCIYGSFPPQTLAKTLAKNLVKDLAKNLTGLFAISGFCPEALRRDFGEVFNLLFAQFSAKLSDEISTNQTSKFKTLFKTF